jgi:toxin YoeB
VDLRFSSAAWEDYQHWLATDRDILRRLNAVIKDVGRSPFEGIGKPEPLKGDLSGWWARRITSEHRLVYRIVGMEREQVVEIAACVFTINGTRLRVGFRSNRPRRAGLTGGFQSSRP